MINNIKKEKIIEPILNLFILSAVFIFLITGIAKILTIFGTSQVLVLYDPLLGIHFSYVLVFAGILELSIPLTFVFKQWRHLTLYMIAWISTLLLVYRIGIRLSGWHQPCSCLGNFGDFIHITNYAADNIMRFVLTYLIIGSYTSLFFKKVRL